MYISKRCLQQYSMLQAPNLTFYTAGSTDASAKLSLDTVSVKPVMMGELERKYRVPGGGSNDIFDKKEHGLTRSCPLTHSFSSLIGSF